MDGYSSSKGWNNQGAPSPFLFFYFHPAKHQQTYSSLAPFAREKINRHSAGSTADADRPGE